MTTTQACELERLQRATETSDAELLSLASIIAHEHVVHLGRLTRRTIAELIVELKKVELRELERELMVA